MPNYRVKFDLSLQLAGEITLEAIDAADARQHVQNLLDRGMICVASYEPGHKNAALGVTLKESDQTGEVICAEELADA